MLQDVYINHLGRKVIQQDPALLPFHSLGPFIDGMEFIDILISYTVCILIGGKVNLSDTFRLLSLPT